MWNNREDNMNYRNQNMNTNFVAKGSAFMQSMRFPPPSSSDQQFFPEESRKRKSWDVDPGHGSVSSGFIGNMGVNMGNLQYIDYTMRQNASFTAANPNFQQGSHQFYNMTSSIPTLEVEDQNMKNTSFGNLRPLDQTDQSFPSHYRENSDLVEMSQAAVRVMDGDPKVNSSNSKLCNPYLFPYPFKDLHLNVGTFDQNISKNEIFEGKVWDQVIRLEHDRNISNDEASSIQTSTIDEGRENYNIYHHINTQIRQGNSVNNETLGSQLNHREQSPPLSQMPVQTESVTKVVVEKQEALNTENTIQPLLDGNSIKSDNNHDYKPIESAGKVSPLVAGKLWDGSIQLSSSTTVSVVAFFKSGEKAQDVKWPEHVETKGKVKLQAFEKYIQGLPRSRNRTLMVISLCWKPGSPETGLAGMKEIAKFFKEKQKVGYAEISPGFDLYICPRSETIITILAKYGFFKGMAALEDDQDSLIGCVIWRRANTLANSVPKATDKKNSPVYSVQESNSPKSQVDESESKQEKTDSIFQETMQVAEIPIKRLEEPKQDMNTQIINESHNSTNFIYSPSSSTITGAQVPIFQAQPSILGPPLSMHQFNNDNLIVPIEEKKRPSTSLNADDDGDLPEFDFDFACGVRKASTTKDPSALILNKQSSVNGVKNELGPVPHPLMKPIGVPQTPNTKYGDTNLLPKNNRSKRSRWDDDDDMPEWCPPEMEQPDTTESIMDTKMHAPVIKPVLKNVGEPNSAPISVATFHPLQQNQGFSNGCQSELMHPNKQKILRPTLENTKEIPLITPSTSMTTFCPPLQSQNFSYGCQSKLEHTDLQKSSMDTIMRITNESAKDVPLVTPPSMMTFRAPFCSQNFSYGCQSELERPSLNPPKEVPLITPPLPSILTFRPQFQNQNSPHRYCPEMSKLPANGFIINDFRPPQLPNSNNAMRPSSTNISFKTQNFDVTRQWKR